MAGDAGVGIAAATGALWYSAAGFLSHAASIAMTIVIARYVGPDNYGVVVVALACVALSQCLLEQTFSDCLVRLPTLKSNYCDTVFWLVLGLAMLLLFALVVMAPVVALIVHEPRVTRLMQALSPLTILTAFTAVPAALLTRDLNYRALFFRSVFGVVGGGMAGIVMATAGYREWSLVAQQLARWVIQVVVLWTASDWRPTFTLSLSHLREVWAYGIKMCCLRMADFVGPQATRIVIGAILGTAALGLYDVAARFCLFLEIILLHPLGILFPAAAKIQNNLPAIHFLITTAMRTAATIAVPALVGLACVAPSLIHILLGEAWVGAASAMPVLCVATFFQLFIVIYQPVMRALGMPGRQSLVTAFITTATLLLLPVLARHGLPFAATAVAIAASLGWPLQILIFRHATGTAVIKQQLVIAPAIIGSALMGVAVLVYRSALRAELGELVLLGTEILIGIVVYVGLMLILQRSFVLSLTVRIRDAAREMWTR